jgi:putative DNA primase/helicase
MVPVISDIQNYLNEYIAFPDVTESGDLCRAVTLWVLHTHTFSESFPRQPWTTPYLYVHSAEKQSGKTTLIDLLESLVLNPERGDEMSSAVLFRLIESRRPTLFIDEVDTKWSGGANEDLRRVMNGGYKHSGYIWRVAMTPDGPEPTRFSTFCPKLLAGIDNGKLPDTVLDRCIPIKLRRASDEERRSEFYSFDAEPLAEKIAAAANQWIKENGERIAEYRPERIEGISGRAWEIALPLVQIAHAAGIEHETRETLSRLLSPRPEKDSPGVAMLRAIRECFKGPKGDRDRIHTDEIIRHLNEVLGSGWNGKMLANRLKTYDVPGPELMRIDGRMGRGYYFLQFTDAWRRYL